VLIEAEVEAVAATGAKLIIAPNCAAPVIAAAKARGLIALPGVCDADRGLRRAGGRGGRAEDVSGRIAAAGCRQGVARGPAQGHPVGPDRRRDADNVRGLPAAGADGFGSAPRSTKPGMSRDELAQKAATFMVAVR
jgi:2-dehydro-3-deoxyphosphogalactonate aldolase